MSEAPSWLTEENISTPSTTVNNPAAAKASKKSSAPPPPPPKAYEPPAAAAAAAAGSDVENQSARTATKTPPRVEETEFVIEKEVLDQMRKWHIALRVAYMIAAILMATAAVLSLNGQDDIGLAFFAIYVLFFSFIICCFEFALDVRTTSPYLYDNQYELYTQLS